MQNFWTCLGDTTTAKIYCEIFGNPSNIILTDNPPFDLDDFQEIFPVFNIEAAESTEDIDLTTTIPYAVFSLFLSMANQSIKYDRYKGLWKYMMCLYIAHYMTLFLETQKGSENNALALANSMPKGVATSKSVDSLSISYDMMDVTSDFSGFGTYKLTAYGQQLITLCKMYASPMWVNW